MRSAPAITAYPPAALAWGVWGLGAALYLIGFYQRVAPAVITNELMADFGLTAAALGNLSAFYFYSYVAMQVPTGIMADRLGPRRLLTAGAAVAAAGTLLFALAPTIFLANAGRLLIGGSVAVAFVGMMKLASHWFVPRQFALATGMALLSGIIGGVFAGVPLRLLVTEFGWRDVMLASAVVTGLLAIAIWLMVRDDPSERGYLSHGSEHVPLPGSDEHPSIARGIAEVLRYRNVWLLYLVPGGIVGTVLTFSGLWGVPFLTAHYRMTITEAAAMTSALMVAWAIGGPLLGALSDRIGRRKPLYVGGLLVLSVCWAVILFIPALPSAILLGMLLVAGFCSGTMVIGFAFAKESAPARLGGTVSGIVNMGVMQGPMVLQPAVGWMLDRNWHGQLLNGARIYELEAYRSGFALMIAWLALSVVLILFTRETHCKQLV
jgi:sugar phosphate permease